MGELSNYACPRCGVALFVARGSSLVMYGCGYGHGVWLDVDDASRIFLGLIDKDSAYFAQRADEVAAANMVTPSQPGNYRDGGDANRTKRCPHCGKALSVLMTTVEHHGAAGFELDYCAVHGVFFDPTELTALGSAAASKRRIDADAKTLALARIAAQQTPGEHARDLAMNIDAAIEIHELLLRPELR